jgi:hypothetical protein
MTCQCANHTYVRLLTDIFGLCGAKKTPESSPRGQVTRRNRNFTALDEGAPALRSFAYSSNETLLRDSWQQANHLLTALSLTPHRTARNFCGPELRRGESFHRFWTRSMMCGGTLSRHATSNCALNIVEAPLANASIRIACAAFLCS